MFLRVFFIGFISLFVSSCSLEDVQDAILPDEIQAEMESMTASILAGDAEAIKEKIHPAALTEDLDNQIIAMLSYVPAGEPVEIKLATAKYNRVTSTSRGTTTTYSASYQLEFPDRWALFIYVLIDDGQTLSFYNVHVNQSEVSYKELNSFTLKGKGVIHFLMLGAALFNVVFIIWSLVVAIRMKDLRRKIAWVIFIAFGLSLFSLNWTTGQLYFTPIQENTFMIYFNILGAGIKSGGSYSPWILTVGFPLGAILFWTFNKRGTLTLRVSKKEKS